MAGPAPLTVVVVHRDRPDRCRQTVARLLDQDAPVRVTLVDNGSDAVVVAELEDLVAGDDRVELMRLGANRGFGPAANAGIRHWLASGVGEWVGVAPHDAQPEPGCLGRLLAAVEERPRAGLASADLGDGATPMVDPYFGGILRPAAVAEGWERAGHPHGTLMLARRACLEEVGLFDERYFAYGEEADLALRAAGAGWEVGLVRGAVVANPDLGSPAPVVDYLQLRNTLLLVREHFGRYRAGIRLLLALGQVAAGALRPSQRSPTFSAPARLQAVADHCRGRYGPPPRLRPR